MKKDIVSQLGLELTGIQIKQLKQKANDLKKKIEKSLAKNKMTADVFIGGSLAKGTLVRKDANDIDIFVRFGKKYKDKDLSKLLFRIIKGIKENKDNIELIHGSRDYARIKKEGDLFEIIPVLKIKKPNEALNVTDLSYFHVNYVKNEIKRGVSAKEIIKAKAFCKSLGIYGAESYIGGFSGYGLECLVINYKSFDKMAKALTKSKENIIIDPKKWYPSKDKVLMELKESKRHSNYKRN